MGKVIFLDVDGTLVDYENHLPPSAVNAIRRARSFGHRVYLCTGRSRVEIEPNLWNIGLDGMIGGNGCYIEDHGQVIYHQALTSAQCTQIVSWLHKRKLEFYLESNSGLFASEHFEEAVYSAFPLREGKHAEARSIFPEMSFGEPLNRDDINKVSFLINKHQDYLDAKAAFKDLSASLWDEAESVPLLASLWAKDVDKATAIEILIKYLGEDLQETIAFGDAGVDIPMLICCGYGVAMGNGSPEIKAAADYVTAPVDQNGLSLAFEALGLLE